MNINTFKAFRSRNYRLYFSGQSVSLIGTWMQRKAVYWLIFVILAGFGMMSQSTVSNTIIQTSVSTEMRGRVISFFAMAFFGMQPLGGLLIGTVSQYIGAPDTIIAEGIAAIIIAVIFLPFLRADILKGKDKIKLIELEDPTVNSNQ